ncbi:PrgI family protein [Candidatus Uhrbacteria bacterium]|nr:PrgI family protein [Candidatus Uhrbacteria bacterium]
MPDKFIVPQFIDKEDQILGPITVRQFLIMLVSFFLVFIAFRLLAFIPFLFVTILVIGIGGTFGFLKINGQPFHVFFLNALQTALRPSLRNWDKRPTDAELRAWIKREDVIAPTVVSKQKPLPENSKLRDLTLVVNTGGVYRPEDENF